MMDDTIYLKVDDTTRAQYEAAGSRPFDPYPEKDRAGGSTQYFEVPIAVLEDADELARWARESIRVAARLPKARSEGTRARSAKAKNPGSKKPQTSPRE